MKFQLSVAALAAVASAASVDVNKRATPLSIKLESVGNSEVKIAVTNNGEKVLNLLSKGTFLDEVAPVEKVQVYSAAGSAKVPFEGIKLRLLTSGLAADDFVALKAGETKEVTVEAASLHSLNDGGDFEVFASGLIPYAEENSTELSGTLPYDSEKLTITVDGAQAAKVNKALDLSKRTSVRSSCTGTKLTAIRTALSNCNKLATSAASAATAGTKLTTYFKSTTTATKNSVSGRLTAVARDCASTTATTTTNCDDQYSGCSSNVLAYTVPSTSYITYCPIFFSALPALSSTCHAQDQATTVLHEECHANSVYSPGTDDLGYGYSAATALSTSQALNNADSFALYANAIYDTPSLRSKLHGFPWRILLIVSLLPLSLAPIIILSAIAEMASQNYIRGRSCYPNGLWKEAAGATWRIMDSTYFFTPNLSFGAMTFTQVKVIDVAWDLVVGRGGQMGLAWVNWVVLNEWLTCATDDELDDVGGLGEGVFVFWRQELE
ncbi:Deuterolysin metalloprotease family-domain-containing protein [Boeremia exigua]|uniref:Deuterolysin metalloprotease family-domain-containing protein n=1 Tax=Boeremia exigua TaxID=749465 RepID=UPI001E8EDC36|nr:Deuterolysin metalloprotease family-domain-containing protein [Boeremia exigua]KAH6625462.1 Deuterolysin metalloprotease family-domain-containing protein [Boeremia exigua]